MMIKRIAFQLLGEKYTKLAIAWHQFITYLLKFPTLVYRAFLSP